MNCTIVLPMVQFAFNGIEIFFIVCIFVTKYNLACHLLQ